MATRMIRNVDAVVKERLRFRAARHGRSMEAEIRSILGNALADDDSAGPNLAEANRQRFAPLGGVYLEPYPPVQIGASPSFDP